MINEDISFIITHSKKIDELRIKRISDDLDLTNCQNRIKSLNTEIVQYVELINDLKQHIDSGIKTQDRLIEELTDRLISIRESKKIKQVEAEVQAEIAQQDELGREI